MTCHGPQADDARPEPRRSPATAGNRPATGGMTRAGFVRAALGALGAAALGAPAAAGQARGDDSGAEAGYSDDIPSASEEAGYSIVVGEDSPTIAETPAVRLMLATDPHVLAPQDAAAQGASERGGAISSGALMTAYGPQVLQALAWQALRDRPDALVLTGDLTNDGELASARLVARTLGAVSREGVPVLVIPGNHDVSEVDGGAGQVSAADFAELFDALGPGAAGTVARDDASGSYVWELPGGSPLADAPEGAHGTLRLLFVDANGAEDPGAVGGGTLEWVRGQLLDARAAGARVVAFSHQLLAGSGEGYDALWMGGAGQLCDLYREFGVAANFCGHIHSQRVGATGSDPTEEAPGSGTADIATSALTLYPMRVATVRVALPAAHAPAAQGADGAGSALLAYRADPLDVAGWAAATGQEDPGLLDWRDFSRESYRGFQRDSMRALMEGMGADEQTAADVADYFARVSSAMLDGTASEVGRRPDLIEVFADLAGQSTAMRLAGFLDPDLYADRTRAAILGA